MRRVSERELRIPALIIIRKKGKISTSNLIKELELLIKPSGEDAKILKGRNDTKFSQKVRNLKSHNSLIGLATYSKGFWEITEKGIGYLEDNKSTTEAIEKLLNNIFEYNDTLDFLIVAEETYNEKSRKIHFYDENEVIFEGELVTKEVRYKTRSNKLRDAAIDYYRVNDSIKCHICSFDFEDFYGEVGKGYIEIHHIKPIYQYETVDTEKFLLDALKNLMPVCSNCHRMLHRKKGLDHNQLIKSLKVNR